jgi:putative inorganic carbon (HCO3(-)) transporter
VAIMVLGLLLSHSRMGLVSLAASATMIAALSYMLRPARQPGARTATDRTPLLLVGLATVALLAGVGIDTAFERFAQTGSDLESGRLPIWRETWSMIRDSPFFGHGFGSYPGLISQYRQGPTGLAFAHAHSDYLEVLAEGGIVGLSIVASWLFLFGRRLWRSLLLIVDPEKRRRTVAAAVAILSVALHSTVDFGLRIPAVAVAFIFVVVIFVRTTEPLSAGQDAPR